MRIVVCMKQVTDTATRLETHGGAVRPFSNGVPGVVNPFDEFALEAALQLREVVGGEVIILSLATGSAEETIFHGLAMGADSAHVVAIPEDTMLDSFATASLLVDALRTLNADIICCGERAVDGEAAQVPSAIAELLDLAVATGVEHMEFKREDGALTVRCRIDSGVEFNVLSLPCVCSFVRGDHVPRYPSLDAIFDAGGKPVVEVAAMMPISKMKIRRVALVAQDDVRTAEKICGEAVHSVDTLLKRIAERTDVLV
jgi:electron transfer flavoprotein beta subunit